MIWWESGFSLIESMVAIALVAAGVGGTLDALAAVSQQRAIPISDAALQQAARNVVADLRAATAYADAAAIDTFSQSLAPVTMSQPVPGGTPMAIRCTVSISAGVAQVACSDGNGRLESLQALVGQQAPAPGQSYQYSPPP